jgi:hypothetical protein
VSLEILLPPSSVECHRIAAVLAGCDEVSKSESAACSYMAVLVDAPGRDDKKKICLSLIACFVQKLLVAISTMLKDLRGQAPSRSEIGESHSASNFNRSASKSERSSQTSSASGT